MKQVVLNLLDNADQVQPPRLAGRGWRTVAVEPRNGRAGL